LPAAFAAAGRKTHNGSWVKIISPNPFLIFARSLRKAVEKI
jgi:hypothetical protein